MSRQPIIRGPARARAPALPHGVPRSHSRQAHNTAGRPTKFAAFGLDDSRLRARQRLFLTATPKRFERDVASGMLRVHSMDDESVYGPVVYRLG